MFMDKHTMFKYKHKTKYKHSNFINIVINLNFISNLIFNHFYFIFNHKIKYCVRVHQPAWQSRRDPY